MIITCGDTDTTIILQELASRHSEFQIGFFGIHRSEHLVYINDVCTCRPFLVVYPNGYTVELIWVFREQRNK